MDVPGRLGNGGEVRAVWGVWQARPGRSEDGHNFKRDLVGRFIDSVDELSIDWCEFGVGLARKGCSHQLSAMWLFYPAIPHSSLPNMVCDPVALVVLPHNSNFLSCRSPSFSTPPKDAYTHLSHRKELPTF